MNVVGGPQKVVEISETMNVLMRFTPKQGELIQNHVFQVRCVVRSSRVLSAAVSPGILRPNEVSKVSCMR